MSTHISKSAELLTNISAKSSHSEVPRATLLVDETGAGQLTLDGAGEGTSSGMLSMDADFLPELISMLESLEESRSFLNPAPATLGSQS